MFSYIEDESGRAWKVSLGTFFACIMAGIEVLSLNAVAHPPSLAAANLGDGLVLIGILGSVLSGLAAWAGRESNTAE